MELKEYQKTCVDEVKRYLEALATCKAEYDALVACLLSEWWGLEGDRSPISGHF